MDKARLTITLQKEILDKVDALIDKTSIRNRSHAIESLITKSLFPRLETAVILAGGEGIKLRPLTLELPKPLIPIQSKPIAEYTIELLKKHNIKNIIFLTGHLGEKIKKYFGNGQKYGIKIKYSQEKKPLGTAGALRSIAKQINSPFLCLHGDILTKINLIDLFHFHQQQKTIATMALITNKETERHGNVRLRGTKILEFQEKPKRGKSLSLLINSGIYLFQPAIFNNIPKKQVSYLEKDVFPHLAQKGQLTGFTFDSPWFDITDNKTYEKALKQWQK